MTKQMELGGNFTFPRTSMSVKRMGYGAMQLAGPQVWGPPRDVDAAIAVLREPIHRIVGHDDAVWRDAPLLQDGLRHALEREVGGAAVEPDLGRDLAEQPDRAEHAELRLGRPVLRGQPDPGHFGRDERAVQEGGRRRADQRLVQRLNGCRLTHLSPAVRCDLILAAPTYLDLGSFRQSAATIRVRRMASATTLRGVQDNPQAACIDRSPFPHEPRHQLDMRGVAELVVGDRSGLAGLAVAALFLNESLSAERGA